MGAYLGLNFKGSNYETSGTPATLVCTPAFARFERGRQSADGQKNRASALRIRVCHDGMYAETRCIAREFTDDCSIFFLTSNVLTNRGKKQIEEIVRRAARRSERVRTGSR